MRYLAIVAATMIFAVPASAAKQACLGPDAPKRLNIRVAGSIANNVLCCCQKDDGGQCCKYVTFCGGFIPGCFCVKGVDGAPKSSVSID